MQEYEYKFYRTDDFRNVQNFIIKESKEGWRLASHAVIMAGGIVHHVIIERLIKTTKP